MNTRQKLGVHAKTLATVLNHGSQANARGATQVFDNGGQAAARGSSLSQVQRECRLRDIIAFYVSSFRFSLFA
jgi:hypothetical protein